MLIYLIIKLIKNHNDKKARRAELESARRRIIRNNAAAKDNYNYNSWCRQQRVYYNGSNNLSHAQREAFKKCAKTLWDAHNRKVR